jgi:hypothetical protein
MKVNGSCHCGRITYEAVVDPDMASVCHCTDCQTLTGSVYRANVQAPAETFVLRGEPKIYVKTADSGNQRAHAFCPDCGSPIYAAAISNPPTYSLRIGSLKQRKELTRPKRQIWCDSAIPWSMDIRDVPQSRRQ